MNRLKVIKVALVAAWALGMVLLLAGGNWLSPSVEAQKKQAPPVAQTPATNPDDYVGTETCTTCHQDQTNHFAKTAHAKLADQPTWKNKTTGCESCHGPGREHVEAGGDKTKIRNFSNLTAKQSSETCLQCHAGREEHNNYRRGEHWRNDVGCIDCHSSHSPSTGLNKAASITFLANENREKPGFATTKLLRASETQLCLQCHTETKHQFQQPSHHKVLEGAMKCGDCHNPHGGFEQKQGRTAVGVDAACLKCHTDKQGPFVYEHAPVKTEGCASCHVPHGSANPRMLRTNRVAQLCLECHSQNLHNGQLFGGATTATGPTKNLNQQYADCTVCHVKVHGSHTSFVFMR